MCQVEERLQWIQTVQCAANPNDKTTGGQISGEQVSRWGQTSGRSRVGPWPWLVLGGLFPVRANNDRSGSDKRTFHWPSAGRSADPSGRRSDDLASLGAIIDPFYTPFSSRRQVKPEHFI